MFGPKLEAYSDTNQTPVMELFLRKQLAAKYG